MFLSEFRSLKLPNKLKKILFGHFSLRGCKVSDYSKNCPFEAKKKSETIFTVSKKIQGRPSVVSGFLVGAFEEKA